MGSLININSGSVGTFLSKEQMALKSLMHVFKNSFEYRTKALMTTTDSALFKYFDDKRPPYRILKGGKTAVVPIYQFDELWGLLQIQSFNPIDKITMGKIKKAINDILIPAIEMPKKKFPCEKMNVFLNNVISDDGIKIALDIMEQSSKNCMVYWEVLKPAPKKISELYDLHDTLIYVKEVLYLNAEQRNLFALYLNLPKKLRGAQVVFSSSSQFSELKKLLHGEALFLEALSKHRVDLKSRYNKSQKSELINNIVNTIKTETSFSHLI